MKQIVTREVFDLDTFDEVKLGKEYEFTPVTTIEEALAALGNDSAKLLEVLNDGMREEMRSQVRATSDGWRTFALDNDGEPTEDLNGEFAGTPADMKSVNALVLTLAKTVFGFSKELTKEQKRAAKESAKEMVKSNDAIKAGLRKSAATK